MAEENKNNSVFVTIPTKIATNRESVREYEFTDKETGELHKMAEITLPKGTMVNGQDVSGYKFSCTQGQLDPGGQKFPNTHSILLPETNKEGNSWNITLTHETGHKDEAGQWVTDEKQTVKCTSQELQAAMKEQYAAYKEYRKEHQQEKAGASLNDEAKDAKGASQALGNNGKDAPSIEQEK